MKSSQTLRRDRSMTSAGEGRVANIREFFEKNTIFNEHPVLYEQQHLSLSVDVWPEENEPAGVPAHLPVLAADGARSKHVYYPH